VSRCEVLGIQELRSIRADFHAANQTPIGLAVRAAQRAYSHERGDGAVLQPSAAQRQWVDAAVAFRGWCGSRNGRVGRRCQAAELAAVRETGLMWAKALRAFQVGKARTSHEGPWSWMRRSRVASAQLSWPACHLTKASASAVMYRSSSRPGYDLQISVSLCSISSQYR
jgi:hypothetical protein